MQRLTEKQIMDFFSDQIGLIDRNVSQMKVDCRPPQDIELVEEILSVVRSLKYRMMDYINREGSVVKSLEERKVEALERIANNTGYLARQGDVMPDDYSGDLG